MKALQKKYLIVFWISLFTVFLLDFVTKRWAVSENFEPMYFIDRLFYVTQYHKNEGIAFGIDLPLVIQIVGSIVIIYLLLNLAFEHLYDKKAATFQVGLLGAIIGGGIGNFIDRVAHGFVIDFIIIRPFPLFNIADIGITVGLVLLFVTILLDKRKSKT